MVGAGVSSVPTLGVGELIICATLGGVGVSTLGGAAPHIIRAGDVYNTLGCEPGLFRRA